MSVDVQQKPLASDELWQKIVSEGVEDRVEVNQRMLIDKMLARYSSDFVVYRELIQNSDDAQATKFTLEITCDPNSATQTYESVNKDYLSTGYRQTSTILDGLGQMIKNRFGASTTSIDTEKEDVLSPSENNYNNCLITEIRTVNNGHIFTEDDWKRVITIAEGNTNVDAIGQFGVGFFSVFSYSERPMIQSGKHCLAFAWQNGRSLTTFRKELPVEQQSTSTSIILSMKNKYILQTNGTTNENQKNGKSNGNRATKSKKNTATNEIVPTLDLAQLKAFCTRVLSFTKYLNELIIKINGATVFQVNKIRKPLSSTKLSLAAKRMNDNNEHNLLRLKTFIQTEKTFSISNGPSITLHHIDVEAEVVIDKEFHRQIQGVLKKSLPPTIHIEFLFPSNDIFEEEQWKTLTTDHLNHRLLKGLIPLKFQDGQISPAGQIFIGLATNQTTGIGMHVFSHLIPTIERENLDLQDPYISIWNEQLLASIGKIVRFIYDQTVLNAVNNPSQQSNSQLSAILSPYAFQSSAPNEEIGRILLDGFFSSDKDILVPVKRSPSDNHLSLIPSTEAYLTTSKHIQTFLPVPLVPFELSKHDFFKALKRRRWIEEIDHDSIAAKIHESNLVLDEFVGLLRWLCTNDIPNKSYIKYVLSKIRFRETRQSPVIKLENIESYDTLNLPSLPLPSNVLPSIVVSHLSREDLQRRLFLSGTSVRNVLEYYLAANQQYLFQNEDTSRVILSFISQRWSQLYDADTQQVKGCLANLKCIPTSRGMKTPNESYIRSVSLSPDLPIISFYIPQLSAEDQQKDKTESIEYPVSLDFLKFIGCRTIHVPRSNNASSTPSTDDAQSLQSFIENLLKQRRNFSDNDLHALKHNPCIQGTTLQLNDENKRKYKPSELHFPSVAQSLQWNQLLIIDWLDINPRSPEYSFLKELGVREVPELPKLIARIEHEHHQGPKSKANYQLPHALVFFVANFQQHYSKIWKNANIKNPFLPCTSALRDQSRDVFLSTPENVFREPGPLCPAVLPDVLQCFSQHFDIALLGVKPRPLLTNVFDILIDKRNQLLNVETAPMYFSYFNKLDGLNRSFIQKIANRAFIPLPGTNTYFKPSQVFIRSAPAEASSEKEKNTANDMATRGLIDYIDFGSEANSFLLSIGVLAYPSADNLADLLIERQASYFAPSLENTNEVINAKLRFYTNCLKQLATVSNIVQQLNVEPLKSRLISRPWCLAYQIVERSDGGEERIFKIARPNEIYLDDDHQSAIDLRPLCAPDEPELTKLYELFGSRWLSETVKRILVHRGKHFVTDRSRKLHDLIHHRLDMLFVNNRGERTENVDEKRLEALRTKFFVYESEGIQCQLSFQNRSVTLNSTECSSCALEHDKNKVCLYIQKDIPTLDYIDIATELTRFVYKKPLDTLIHPISDKLASPLETLKRRGIPVDRLLKTTQQQPAIKLAIQVEQPKIAKNVQSPPLQEQAAILETDHQKQPSPSPPPKSQVEPHHHQPSPSASSQSIAQQLIPKMLDQYQQSDQTQRGFFQSLKDLLVPMRSSSPALPVDPVENVSSNVETDRVEHFGRYKSTDENDITRMIRTSRPYSQTEFNQPEHSRNEINNSCEFIPASNMVRYDDLLHGIPLYLDQSITLTGTMIDQGKQLAWLLAGLAKEVFNMPVQTIHLFRDIDSARIAFNTNGALFFNLRYFEQVFADDLKTYLPNASSSIPIVRNLVNFYFMVACHELSHNVDSSHDLNFINRLERVSVRFMDAKDAFLSRFSFK